MNKKIKKMYYDTRCGFQIIGCLLKKPELLSDIKYQINHGDFVVDFHKGIFTAINNLIQEGIEEITAIEIEAYLSRTSPKFHKIIFDDNDGFDWIEESIANASLSNFDYNYNRLKKMSYLRDQIEEGNSVADILDLQEIDNATIEKQTTEFDKMTLGDLKKHFEARNIRVNAKYTSENMGDYKRAGEGAEKTLSRLKAGETYGPMSFSGYKNRVTYGARRKKFHLMSSDTGGGKSRHSLGEIGSLIAIEIWDHDKQAFVKNPNNPKGDLSGIYIGTELELDMEVDIILWAVVSGIETSKIIEMDLTEEEEERLDYAIEIIKRSKIHLYDRPNYDIAQLEGIVKKHQIDEDVYVLCIDYIMLTSNLVLEAREYSQNMWTREDQLFLFISKSFKERLANALNIYVSSSTQLNRSVNDKASEKNAGMIRGSFSLCDKVDCASIVLEVEKKELEFVDEILKKGWDNKKPTHVEHIFKNRGGKIKACRIFKRMNLGNMKMEDLFCTDWDYKLLDVEQVFAEPYLEEQEEGNGLEGIF